MKASKAVIPPFEPENTNSVVFAWISIGIMLRPIFRMAGRMNRTIKPELIYSQPTTCLHCHLLVELFHERHADPANGAWKCPNCGRDYPFAYWKIRKQTKQKLRSATSA